MSDNLNYETRITQVVVVPEGQPMCSELATTIQIEDEAEGMEFLILKQDLNGEACIRIYPPEWPAIRAAIDDMMAKCRRD